MQGEVEGRGKILGVSRRYGTRRDKNSVEGLFDVHSLSLHVLILLLDLAVE